MIKKAASLLVICILIPMSLWAQGEQKVGKMGAQFLKIGLDSRAVSMGNAYTALGSGAAATFWNPGALTTVDNNSIFIIHIPWFAETQYSAFSFAKNLRNIGVVGLSVANFSSGDIEETTIEQQDGTGVMFSTNNMMVGLSYARKLTDRLMFGSTIKYIREDLWVESADAIGADIGVIYFTDFRDLSLGISIRNYGINKFQLPGKYKDYDNGIPVEEKAYKEYEMPMEFRVGVAMNIWEKNNNKLLISVDGVHPSDNDERASIGAEFTFMDMVFVRSGYIINHDTQDFNAGGGIKQKFGGIELTVDYAYSNYFLLGAAHRFALSFDF